MLKSKPSSSLVTALYIWDTGKKRKEATILERSEMISFLPTSGLCRKQCTEQRRCDHIGATEVDKHTDEKTTERHMGTADSRLMWPKQPRFRAPARNNCNESRASSASDVQGNVACNKNDQTSNGRSLSRDAPGETLLKPGFLS